MTPRLRRIEEQWPPSGGTAHVRPVPPLHQFLSVSLPLTHADYRLRVCITLTYYGKSAMLAGLGDSFQPRAAATST